MSIKSPATGGAVPGIFASLIAWGKRELGVIAGDATNLWDEIEPGLVTEAESIVAQFLGTAISAVQEQATQVLSGDEKFSNAKDAVVEAIEAAGQSAGNTLVEFLVNLALSVVKMATGQTLV